MRLIGCLVLLAAAAATAAAQQALPPPGTATTQPKGTGVVMGQVVDARGAGVASAIVMLQGGYRAIALTTDNREIPGGPRYTITTGDGRFAFFELTPGTYAFLANRPGFIEGAHGRRRPGGQAQSITLGDGEVQTSIRIQMWDYATVSGTVRDETGEAVVGVQVRALRRAIVHGRFQWTNAPGAATNDRGEYRIDSLPPGQYLVVVAATQTSLPPNPNAGAAPGTPALQTELLRFGVLPPGLTAGAREISGWAWNPSNRSAMTVPNPSADGRILVYPTTFYPSSRSSRDAESIALEPGQERVAVDFQMRLVPATTVSGVLTAADGPAAGLAVRLAPEYAEDLAGDLRGLETALSVCDATGRFLFIGVPTGQYFLQAEATPTFAPTTPGGPAAPVYARKGWMNDRVTVGEDGVTNLAMTLRPTVRVSGRIHFDGTKPPPAPDLIARLVVSIETVGFNVNRIEAPYQATFDRNGQFVLPAVPPGQYVLTFRASIPDRRAMPDWETKGVTLEGRDVSDRVLTLTEDVSGVVVSLTDRNTELNGTVRDAAGNVDPTAAVLMFTAERELWPVRMVRRIRLLRASETGTYSVRGVPAGEYFLLAIPDEEVGDYPDPRMLETLSKVATRFVMAPAETKTQNLVVRSIK